VNSIWIWKFGSPLSARHAALTRCAGLKVGHVIFIRSDEEPAPRLCLDGIQLIGLPARRMVRLIVLINAERLIRSPRSVHRDKAYNVGDKGCARNF